jgi:hypothetical protein
LAMSLGVVSMARAMQVPVLPGRGMNSMPGGPSAAPTPPQSMQNSPSAPSAAAPQSAAPAQSQFSGCGCGPVCQPQMIERTICVPQPSYEKRTIQCTEYTTEQQPKTVTVLRMVPETTPVTQQYCEMIPEKRQRTEYYTVCKPVQTEAPACGCGGCGSCCKMVEEKRERIIEYTVCVPQMKTRTVNITTCKYVPEQRTVMCSICVPHTVEKQVDVCVYHMVEKKILCPGPTCCNYGCGCGYGGCGWRGCW